MYRRIIDGRTRERPVLEDPHRSPIVNEVKTIRL
jgi:hypothetical protein